MLEVTCGKRKGDREKWWWNEEGQEHKRKERGKESMRQNKR